MNKNDNTCKNQLKEFSENDVKNIYESVDENNGFDIEFAINLYRSSMKTQPASKQSASGRL